MKKKYANFGGIKLPKLKKKKKLEQSPIQIDTLYECRRCHLKQCTKKWKKYCDRCRTEVENR